MSKRFREIVSVETIVDDLTGKRYVGIVDSAFIDLVNNLHEENEQLKSFNKYLNELLKDLNGVSIEIEKVI